MSIGECKAAEGTLVLSDVRLPGGGPVDVYIHEGMIAEIGPGLAARHEELHILAGQGQLLMPGMVDGHMHLDKTLTGLPWMPHQAGPDRLSRIETEKVVRAGLPSVSERASNLVRKCIAHRTTSIRTHVDIDPVLGLEHLQALLTVREAFAEQVEIQIVAFPQSGVLRSPGTAELLEEALTQGADLLGGIDPIGMDGDLAGQFDILFDIAERQGVGLDVHLHDPGSDGLAEITAFCERVAVQGLAGRATVSHGFSLGTASEEGFSRIAEMMARAGVSLVTHGGGASPLPPVKALRERGVEVFAGNDDVRDPWSPFGEGDMLERAMLIAWRSGYRRDEDLAIAFECASAAGARALSLDKYGLAPGCWADLFTLPSGTLAEGVVSRPGRGWVLKRGRVVAQNGEIRQPGAQS